MSSSPLRRFTVVAAVAVAASLAACVDAPSAPGTSAPSTAAPSLSLGGDRRAALERQADSIRASLEAQERRARATYESLKDTWKAQRDRSRGGAVQIVECEPQRFEYDVRIVGRSGGTLKMGPHRLTIPVGALDSDVVVYGVAPVSPVREVRFGPHGLTFDRSARLELSYDHCTLPRDFHGQVAYVDGQYRVLELPRTKEGALESLRAAIDHFSGYVIAHTRIGRAAELY